MYFIMISKQFKNVFGKQVNAKGDFYITDLNLKLTSVKSYCLADGYGEVGCYTGERGRSRNVCPEEKREARAYLITVCHRHLTLAVSVLSRCPLK